MKINSFRLFCFLAGSVLAGCIDTYEPDTGTISSNHFVQAYLMADDLKLSLDEVEDSPFADLDFIGIDFSGERLVNGSHIESEQQRFDLLAERYCDVTYQREVCPGSPTVLGEEVFSIDISSKDEFDSTHHAGQSLGDIVTLSAAYAYDFIDSGYRRSDPIPDFPEQWTFFVIRAYGFTTVVTPLNELNRRLRLMNPTCYLIFTRKPAVPGTYTFTVTARVGDQVISRRIDYTFDSK